MRSVGERERERDLRSEIEKHREIEYDREIEKNGKREMLPVATVVSGFSEADMMSLPVPVESNRAFESLAAWAALAAWPALATNSSEASLSAFSILLASLAQHPLCLVPATEI